MSTAVIDEIVAHRPYTTRGPSALNKDYAVLDKDNEIVAEAFGHVGRNDHRDAKTLAERIAAMLNGEVA